MRIQPPSPWVAEKAAFQTNEMEPVIDTQQSNLLVCIRFVPLRIKTLIGGPSSTRQFEWHRQVRNKDGNGWSEASEALPISTLSLHQSPPVAKKLPVTIAITGTHCAGKATLGKRIANVLGWTFDAELGDILRKSEDILSGKHKVGYGSCDSMSWDDLVFREEAKRDQASSGSRVVETWHVGNLAWAQLRTNGQSNDNRMKEVRSAIQQEISKAVVLFVHLSVSAETSVRRRRAHPANIKRLPMEDEEVNCQEMHDVLDTHGTVLLDELADLGIPVLALDNSDDGKEAIEEASRRIYKFVNQNIWRCGLVGH
jgi:nucleoside-triphosphatase THEP1